MTADAPEHAGFRDAGKRDLDDRPRLNPGLNLHLSGRPARVTESEQ
jgi:hypothetical protein